MIKFRKTLRFIVSFVIILSILASSCLVVFADPIDEDSGGGSDNTSVRTTGGYAQAAGNMLKCFADGGEGDLTIDQVTESEFRAWGVIVSNFAIPFHTNPTALDEDTDVKDTNGKKYNLWKHICKVWNKSGKDATKETSLLYNLKRKYETCFIPGTTLKLLYDNDKNSHKVKDIIGTSEIAKNNLYFRWKKDDGNLSDVVFNSTDYNMKALLAFVRSIDFNIFYTKDKAELDSILQMDLYVSPFGDICGASGESDVVIVVPACLNPYTFTKDGSHFGRDGNDFMINNILVLSNFLSSKDISNRDNIFDSTGTPTEHAIMPAEDKSNGAYNSFFYGGELVGSKVSWLSSYMHAKCNSMVPYIQRTRNLLNTAFSGGNGQAVAAGLTFDARDSNSKQQGYAALGYTQPLWSIAYMKIIADDNNTTKYKNYDNVIAITGRSNLIDAENIHYAGKSGKKKFDKYRNNDLITFTYNQDMCFERPATKIAGGNNIVNDFDSYQGKAFAACYQSKNNVIYSDGTNNELDIVTKEMEDFNKDSSAKNESQYLVLYLAGQFESLPIEKDRDNYKDIDSLMCFQIPINEVVSKIGKSDNGIATTNTDKFTAISAINYADTTVEEPVLKRYHSGAKKYDTSKNNYQPGGSKHWCLALPESLYALSGIDFRASSVTQLSNGSLAISLNRNLFANIYWAYIEDIVGITAEKIAEKVENGEQLSDSDIETKDFSYLPPIPDVDDFASSLEMQLAAEDMQEALEDAANAELDAKQASIIDWTYKILSGGTNDVTSSAGQYVISWLKSVIDDLFIGIHNALVGIDIKNGMTGSVSTIGNTNQSGVYATSVGYITTPNFDSLPITSWVASNFNVVYVGLMALVFVILVFMVVSRARPLSQVVGILLVMAFVMVLPANLLNSSINVSNIVAEKLYSEKFMYWALMQHAEYLTKQASADNSTVAALQDNLSRQEESTKTGGVTLKWLCPKKWGITEQIKSVTKNTKGLGLFLYFAGDVLDDEDYSYNISSDGTYLYRSYTAIFTEAKGLSESLATDKSKNYSNKLSDISKNISAIWLKDASYGVISNLKGGGTNSTIKKSALNSCPQTNLFKITSVRKDTIFRPVFGGESINDKGKALTYPVGYYDTYYGSYLLNIRNNNYQNNDRIYSMYIDKNLISTIMNFNKNNVSWNPQTANKKCGLWITDHNRSVDAGDTDANIYKEGVRTFLDYSESPYYYFYNVFSSATVKSENSSELVGSEDFLALLLSDDFFKVTDKNSRAYGEIKDYLDFEGLFTYIIPLLDYSNQEVKQYFDKWGYEVKRADFKVSETSGQTSQASRSSSQSSQASRASSQTSQTSHASSQTSQTSHASSQTSQTSRASSQTSQTSDETSESSGSTKELKEPETQEEKDYEEHKSQNQAVWNMYSPWVHALMDANDTKQEANSGFGRVDILEPCNPAEYTFFNRPMAYSPAESLLRGYEDVDLTKVEYKLHRVLKDTYNDLIELVNYKDLTSIEGGNDILISAAAMLATFHFNQEFSDTGFMSTEIQLYPVSFELKNMNYDAYLRLIMGNSMGVNQVKLMQTKSTANQTIYEVFIHNTSIVSAIILVLVDSMGVFIIPLMKILLIAVIFFLAIALSVSCIINAPDKILPTIINTFVIPLLAMIAIFTAHAIVVSWFIGDGATGVIDSHSISVTTGDPTVTLLLLFVVDLVTAILMWKLLKFAAVSTVKYIKATFTGIKDLANNVFGNIVGTIGAVAGVGTLAVGTAGLVGKAAAGTVKAGSSLIKGNTLKRIEKNTRNGASSGEGSTGGTGGKGGNGNGENASGKTGTGENGNTTGKKSETAVKKSESGSDKSSGTSEYSSNGKSSSSKPVGATSNGQKGESSSGQTAVISELQGVRRELVQLNQKMSVSGRSGGVNNSKGKVYKVNAKKLNDGKGSNDNGKGSNGNNSGQNSNVTKVRVKVKKKTDSENLAGKARAARN